VFLSCANIEVVMYRKTAPDKQTLETLRQALISDPTNLDAANRYWNAVGSSQSGSYVIEAYRSAALTSQAGVVAFVRAYRELFENSGEPPRAIFFDKDLVEALEASLPALSQSDCSVVEWVLQSIR
jgi:hypothetical protein